MASEIQPVYLKDFGRSTPVLIDSAAGPLYVCPEDVLKWLPNAPLHEVIKFLVTCRSAGLDPLLNEANLLELGGKWTVIITKGGYLKRAQRHPDYDGFEAGIVIQKQARDARGQPIPREVEGGLIEVQGALVPRGHLLVGGWAKVHRKSWSRPTYTVVSLSEYDRVQATWGTLKCTMIRKTALTHAIREAFAISDSYDECEFPETAGERPTVIDVRVANPTGGERGHPGGVPELEAMYNDHPDPTCPPKMVEAIRGLQHRLGFEGRWLDGILLTKYDCGHITALTPQKASHLISVLEGYESRGDFLEAFPHAMPRRPSVAFSGQPTMEEAMVQGGLVAVAEAGGDGPPSGEPEDAGVPVAVGH